MNRLQVWFLWMAFVFMIVMNVLANALPINGMNTGEVSALFTNRFVPAGFTFSIWSVIYLGLLAGSIYITRFSEIMQPSLVKYLQWSFVLNGCWILAWHYLQMTISVLIMLALLIILINAVLLTSNSKKYVSVPIRIYFSWILVATIANIAAWFTGLGWDGSPLEGWMWSAAMMVIATGLSIFLILQKGIYESGWVLIWALFGIRAAQGASHSVLMTLPLVLMGIILVTNLYKIFISKAAT